MGCFRALIQSRVLSHPVPVGCIRFILLSYCSCLLAWPILSFFIVIYFFLFLLFLVVIIKFSLSYYLLFLLSFCSFLLFVVVMFFFGFLLFLVVSSVHLILIVRFVMALLEHDLCQ